MKNITVDGVEYTPIVTKNSKRVDEIVKSFKELSKHGKFISVMIHRFKHGEFSNKGWDKKVRDNYTVYHLEGSFNEASLDLFVD